MFESCFQLHLGVLNYSAKNSLRICSYFCLAKPPGYFRISINMTSLFLVAPQNLSLLSTSYIFVNGSGAQELECTFEGNPDVTVNWLYNGSVPNSPLINITSTLVSKDIYHERKRSILKMNVVDKNIQGVYRCIASNHQGSVSQETQLVIFCKFDPF